MITLNLPETNAGIVSINSSKEISNKKLKKRILDEIQKDYALTVSNSTITNTVYDYY